MAHTEFDCTETWSRLTRLNVVNNEYVGIGDPTINQSWEWRRRGRV